MGFLEVDADYTTTLNLFLELGLKKYFSRQLTEEDTKLIISYLHDDRLKEEATGDTIMEWYNNKLQQYYQHQLKQYGMNK